MTLSLRPTLVAFLLTASASAQTNVRGNNAGTNEFAVKPVRSEPKVAWEVKTLYRDGGGIVVIGNVLVTGNINGGGGSFGYDTGTGKLLWSIPGHLRGDPASDGTYAYVINKSPEEQFVLRKVDPKTGKVLWSAQGSEMGVHDAPPVVADGKVLVAYYTGYNLQAYDAASRKLLWEHNKRFDLNAAGMAYAGGLLYVAGSPAGAKGTLTALDGATGQVVWSVTPKSEYRGKTSGPAVANGTVVTMVNNEIFAVDAATGAPRWQQKVRRDLSFEPAIADGVVYAYWDEGIVGWDLGSGTPVFQLPMKMPNSNYSIRMAIAGGVLYAQAAPPPGASADPTITNGWLHAIDLTERRVLWSHQCYRVDQYNKSWSTNGFVPVEGAMYYNNRSILVKLVP